MLEQLNELIDDLARRQKSCFELAGKSYDKTQARLLGKAAAYEHAADLLRALVAAKISEAEHE